MRAACRWVHDRSLTLVMLGLFAVFTVGQVLTGWHEFNDELTAHGRAALSLGGYLATGHLWEAIFENWESEFLQMALFVHPHHVPLPEGLGRIEASARRSSSSTRPADFAQLPGRAVAGASRRLGVVLYQQSLGIALRPVRSLVSFACTALSAYATSTSPSRRAGETRPSPPAI